MTSNRGKPLYARRYLLVQIRFLNRWGRRFKHMGERLTRRASQISDNAVKEYRDG